MRVLFCRTSICLAVNARNTWNWMRCYLKHACSHLNTLQCYYICACLCGCWVKHGYVMLKGVEEKKKPHQPLCTSALLVRSWLMWQADKKHCPHHKECDGGRQHTLTLNVMESFMDEYPKEIIEYSNTPYTFWNSWGHSESNWKKIHTCLPLT